MSHIDIERFRLTPVDIAMWELREKKRLERMGPEERKCYEENLEAEGLREALAYEAWGVA